MLPLLEVSVPAYSAHHTCARVRSIDALEANIDELKSEKDKLTAQAIEAERKCKVAMECYGQMKEVSRTGMAAGARALVHNEHVRAQNAKMASHVLNSRDDGLYLSGKLDLALAQKHLPEHLKVASKAHHDLASGLRGMREIDTRYIKQMRPNA